MGYPSAPGMEGSEWDGWLPQEAYEKGEREGYERGFNEGAAALKDKILERLDELTSQGATWYNIATDIRKVEV